MLHLVISDKHSTFIQEQLQVVSSLNKCYCYMKYDKGLVISAYTNTLSSLWVYFIKNISTLKLIKNIYVFFFLPGHKGYKVS